MGAFNLAGLLEGLEGFSIALYTRVLGYSVEKVQTILADVRAQLRNPKIHAVSLVSYTNENPRLLLTDPLE